MKINSILKLIEFNKLKKSTSPMINEHILTFDLEWAPDFAIEFVANELIQKKIKSTWFITHDSIAIRNLQNNPLFNFGIHPNFLPNSTHGETIKEIMKNLMDIIPNPKSIRTHGLFQSSYLYRILVREYGIEIDSSILMPEIPNLVPHTVFFEHEGKPLIRFPIFWEDDIEMYNPYRSWDLKNSKYNVDGMKVYNFHPLHIWLNSNNMKSWEYLKSKNNLAELNENFAKQHINEKPTGVRNLFKELCEHIHLKQKFSSTFSELSNKWLIDKKSQN